MRVVIAGSGDLSRYMCEAFSAAGHDVVVLTRTIKPHLKSLNVKQFVTDYTQESLAEGLSGAEAIVSTIQGFTPAYTEVHKSLIEACRKTTTCKRFIPSEFVGDSEIYPDQPGFYPVTRAPIRETLRNQNDLEWSIICIGWFADYLVPSRNRYLKDIGNECPVDITGRSLIIPGTGREPVNFVWAKDLAQALVELVVSEEPWEPYTYITGQRASWGEAAGLVQRTTTFESVKYVSLHEAVETVRTAKDENTLFLADHYFYSISHACALPVERVEAQRRKYFANTRFRTLEEGLTGLRDQAEAVV